MNRAVFLDRDGVLNESIVKDGKPYPPQGVSQLKICDGVPVACADLRRAGFVLIVVTNQPDVARMTQDRKVVEAIHYEIAALVPIDDFYVCYHDDAAGCDCRKPKPGLLLAATRKWSIDLQQSFMVGDRWRDVDAGIAAGCRTVFIDRSYSEHKIIRPHFTAKSLREAADWIISVSAAGKAR